MALLNDTYCNINHYFETLKKLGYYKPNDVYKLLIMIFITRELLGQRFVSFINQNDYNSISKALNCLYGTSCLTPFPTWKRTPKRGTVYINDNFNKIRFTEDSLVNTNEDNSINMTESSIDDYLVVTKNQ